jgi:hypothetical protein
VNDERPDGKRRTVGLAMFGSAAVMGAASVLLLTGIVCMEGQSNHTLGALIGGVAVLDALLGVYFVLSGGSD